MAFISQLFAPDHAAEIFQGLHKNYDLTFLEAVCQFSHFVKVKFQPKMNDLREYLKAAAAIVCEQGEHGNDIIIPLAIPRKSGQKINFCNHKTYFVSAIFVQVKNSENNFNSMDLAKKIQEYQLSLELSASEVGNNQLYMIMGVGEGGNTNDQGRPFFFLKSNLMRVPIPVPETDQLNLDFVYSLKEEKEEEEIEFEEESTPVQGEGRKRKSTSQQTGKAKVAKLGMKLRSQQEVEYQILVLQKTGFQSSNARSDQYPFLKENELGSLRALCNESDDLFSQLTNDIDVEMNEEDRKNLQHILQPRMYRSGATNI